MIFILLIAMLTIGSYVFQLDMRKLLDVFIRMLSREVTLSLSFRNQLLNKSSILIQLQTKQSYLSVLSFHYIFFDSPSNFHNKNTLTPVLLIFLKIITPKRPPSALLVPSISKTMKRELNKSRGIFSKIKQYFNPPMSDNRLSLISRGCNSELFSYGFDENRVVLKVVSSMNRKEQTHLKNEFNILKTLEHQNIIKALRYQQKVTFQRNKMDKQFVCTKNILVLEYAQEGSLLRYIQNHQLLPGEKRQLFKGVAEGLRYLHRQSIAHRDLKLENILVFVEGGSLGVKISDFGFATHFQKEGQVINFSEYKGTRKAYMAPQIHLCQNMQGKEYDVAKSDIFALGVVLFALMVGTLPFEYAIAENKLYELLIDKKYEDFWNYHSQLHQLGQQEGFRLQEFKEIFQRMTSFNASERPSAEEIVKCGWII